MKFLLIISLLFLSDKISANAFPEKTGTVVKIVDGDTFDLLTENKKTIRVRMYGIDCPEKKQAFYQSAKNALARFIFKKHVRLVITGHDRNGRLIAWVYYNGQNINTSMIRDGFAWHFKKYAADLNLATAEKEARLAKRGIWQIPGAIAPWEFRKSRQKITRSYSVTLGCIQDPLNLIPNSRPIYQDFFRSANGV